MVLLQVFLVILSFESTLSDILSDSAHGKIVNFPCGVDFFRFALAEQTVCPESTQSGRQAKVFCLDGGLMDMNGEAKFVHLDRPLVTGDRLIIIGTPPKNTVLEMSLLSGDDIVLYLSARFNHLSTTDGVIMNSDIGGSWGTEVFPTIFPFVVGMEFNITIEVKTSEYQIFVNGVSLHTYPFRVPAPTVTRIRFWGDILVKSLLVD